MEGNIAQRIKAFFVNYFTMSAQLLPQQEAEQSIRGDVSFHGTNIVILVLAILIASLGLNTNSTAVIIGAMLISPLMGPIIGLGLGVGIHDYQLIRTSLRNLLMASLFSVAASSIYFLISPVSEGHSELLARTSPTIYDVLIGFVGGGAGILAIASRSKGNVIPGVAIATALMPPLCTAGYGLATWQLAYFFGAFYLFLINSIYIAFATFIGVKLLGYKSSDTVDTVRSRRVRRVVYTVAILTMLPSVYLTFQMLRDNKFRMRASDFVAHECVWPNTQVVDENASIGPDGRTITITLIGQTLPADSLQLALSGRLKFYNLEGTSLRIVQGGVVETDKNADSGIHDVYQIAQATILAQQRQIDSLRAIAAVTKQAGDAGAVLAPELKVVFPQVADIAVVNGVFASTSTAGADTLNLALVHFSSTPSAETLKKLREYLEARLQLPEIKIINTPSIADDLSSSHNSSAK